jgi:phytoene dehydrogenase-like protein
VSDPDAVVVGSGPNGLAAAIAIARTGRRVVVFEAEPDLGGGVRSAALTLPGFLHDRCSAVYPMAAASPWFRTLPLASQGLEWIVPAAAVAHPFDDGSAVLVEQSIERTASQLGTDGDAYDRTIGRVVRSWSSLESIVFGPLHVPRHPLAAARFGWTAIRSVMSLATRFKSLRARGVIAGLGAHAMLPLDRHPTAAFALTLGATAHLTGWPIVRGGAHRLTEALVGYLHSLGGATTTGHPIRSLDELPRAKIVLCDLSPRPMLQLAGDRFPAPFRRRLERYRYGMAVFKMDWALSAAIPWRASACARAGTVHVGGTFEEIAQAEHDAWTGRISDRPFVLLSQPTLFDPSRAPAGRHIAWGYCHVPNGSTRDMSDRIERQIERFAPGFRDCIVGRAMTTPADLERENANYVGGDIGAGAADLVQLFRRPTWRWYSTPIRGLYICSAATPPGAGVHGMCGYHAAMRALIDIYNERLR